MGSAVTASGPLVYFDSNVFIAAFETKGAHADHAWWIIRAIEAGEIEAKTSELTLAELLVKPLQSGMADLAAAYQAMITAGPSFEVLPVSRDILVGAAAVRAARNSVKLPDAVHIATARSASCGFFVSEDRRLPMPSEITLLPVNPFTLDDIRGSST
jgi:predicted nucleic acid-binding protein